MEAVKAVVREGGEYVGGSGGVGVTAEVRVAMVAVVVTAQAMEVVEARAMEAVAATARVETETEAVAAREVPEAMVEVLVALAAVKAEEAAFRTNRQMAVAKAAAVKAAVEKAPQTLRRRRQRVGKRC